MNREGINQQAVIAALANPQPSVNGGVFAARTNSPILGKWYDATMAVRDIFIADETVLHAICAEYSSSDSVTVWRGGAYNCSPKFQPEGLADEEVHIWHFHGDSNVRPNKSKKGIELWWPMFERCMNENLGNVRHWVDRIDNRYFNRLRKAKA